MVVECLPPALFREVAISAIEQRAHFHAAVGRRNCWTTRTSSQRAKEKGGRILVPTGALIGLDAVRAAAEGTIDDPPVTRKPPAGLEGAPYLVQRGISLAGSTNRE